MPLSQSRAEYWLGRAAVAAGDDAEAAAPFQARRRLSDDLLRTARPRPPRRQAPADQRAAAPPTRPSQARFEARELVQVIQRLTAAESRRPRRTSSTATLAETLDRSGRARAPRRHGGERTASISSRCRSARSRRRAACRSRPSPSRRRRSRPRPRPRRSRSRWSMRSPGRRAPSIPARSAAPARAASSSSCRRPPRRRQASVGLPFSKARLTSDPAYNATLGAAHLGELVRRLRRLLRDDLRRLQRRREPRRRTGSSSMAIRATRRSTSSTGSSSSRSPRRATTSSGSWRTCRSTAPASARRRSASKPTCTARRARTEPSALPDGPPRSHRRPDRRDGKTLQTRDIRADEPPPSAEPLEAKPVTAPVARDVTYRELRRPGACHAARLWRRALALAAGRLPARSVAQRPRFPRPRRRTSRPTAIARAAWSPSTIAAAAARQWDKQHRQLQSAHRDERRLRRHGGARHRRARSSSAPRAAASSAC